MILAGGRSSRMGRDKALVPLGGRPMIAAVIARLAPQAAPLAISANGDPARFAAFGLPVLPDAVPGHPGPLAGVLAAMDWAAGLGADAVVTVPVDVPLIPADLVGRLAAAGPFALARTPGGWQGACALWPVGLRARLRADLGAGMRRLTDWARAQGAVAADFDDEAAFANVNTPADLAGAEAAIAR
ncbi:MAG: molybdenum cofactor guanylyltransferase MobA [Gemmobacter sp.]